MRVRPVQEEENTDRRSLYLSITRPGQATRLGLTFVHYWATLIRSLIASNLAFGSAFFRTISCLTL